MLYIITEDSNSARVFWEIVVNEFRGKNNYILVPLFKGKDSKDSGGNTTLKSQVTQLIDSLNTYDELLVVFDNINNSRNFNKVRFIKWALNICKIYNINIRFTDYYCFEEVYLSYSELIDMYMKCNYKKIVLDTLKFVNASITNYKDYYDRNNKLNSQKFSQLISKSISTCLAGICLLEIIFVMVNRSCSAIKRNKWIWRYFIILASDIT